MVRCCPLPGALSPWPGQGRSEALGKVKQVDSEGVRLRTSSRPRRSQGNRPSDNLLLDAACEVFHEVGFHAAAMEKIAERADVSKPTLYAHFGNKVDLYQACLERESKMLQKWLCAAYESAIDLNIDGQVHADMLALFEYAAAHPAGFGLLFDDATSGPNTTVRDRLTDSISARIAEKMRAYFSRRSLTAPSDRSIELLGSMLVGVGVHGARQALVSGANAVLVGDLASSLASAGLRHLDRATVLAIDQEENSQTKEI